MPRLFSMILLTVLVVVSPARGGEPAKAPPRLDAYGDPLPEGALLRLGTTRFRHGGIIHAVVLSPDGKVLATGGGDDAVRLSDAATGKELHLLRGHSFQSGMLFSRDGKTLVTSDGSGTLRLWDTAEGKELRRFGSRKQTSPGLPRRISGMVWSPDERTLWAADGPFVRQWLPVAGLELHVVNLGNAQALDVAISPDGRELFIAGSDAYVRVWDIRKNQELRRFAVPMPKAQVGPYSEGAMAFSADARHFAVAAYALQTPLQVFDTQTGKSIREFGSALNRPAAVTFAPSGKAVAGLSSAGVVIWGLASGQELRRFDFAGGVVQRGVLSFSADGKLLACAGVDQSVRLWELVGSAELGVAAGHQGGLQSIYFTADGKLLVSAATDRTVRLWDATDGKELSVFAKHSGYVQLAIPAPTGKTFFVPTMNGIEHLKWDGKSLRDEGKLETIRLGSNVMAVSADRRRLAAATIDSIQVIDAMSGKVVHTLGKSGDPANRPNALAFSPDGTLLASGGFNAPIQFWNLKTGRMVRSLPLPPKRTAITRLFFSPDGNTLVAGDYEFHLWEVATGQERLHFATSRFGSARGAVYSPRGDLLVLGATNGVIWLVDPLSGFEVDQWPAHRGDVRCLAFSPDGTRLASGGGDSTILLWDAARLDNKLRRAPIQLQDAEVELLWKLLGQQEADRAYQAIGALVAASEQSVPLIAKHLRPAPPLDAKEVDRWIKDLNDAQFQVRQKAFKELERVGELAEDALLEALKGKPPLEMRQRLEQLVGRLKNPSMEKVQTIRAVEVLDRAATPAARAVLAKLADGAPGQWLTEMARHALQRATR